MDGRQELVSEQPTAFPVPGGVVEVAVGYTSPISAPGWLNTTLLIAGTAASLERTLTLRSHWLIDLKPWWLG